MKKTLIFKNICIGLILLCFSAFASAQTVTTYPVQVYTQLMPPYTPYIPSFYSGGVEKMRVTLINTDMQQPLLDVFLKMKITSSTFSMQTPDAVRMPSITLQAGVPAILSLSDLEPYFRKENLSISGGQSQFFSALMLPDNFYRFHFEVYEVNTGRLLSNKNTGFAQTLIAAGDPPVLNLPLKGSVVQESNIPNIMFTWTPRHLNSVAAAYGTEYELSLVEIYDKQTSPENAFQYSRALFSERTRATSFIYNSAYPLLQPGRRYGWRVQAVACEGLEDAQVFKNNGYSEIFWFDYKGNCPAVSSSGVVIKGLEATVSWQPTQAIDYTLEYRKKGGSKWYPVTVSGTSGAVYGLQWGETYEYRIGSRCYANDVCDYSDTKAFTMPDLPERNPNCGIMPDANLANRTPVTELIPGMPVFAGDFPIFITEVQGNGVFSGTGYVGLPVAKLPRITVTFSNITVNTDYRLMSGFFETKYDIKNNNLLWNVDQTMTGGKGVGDVRTGDELAQFVVDYTINPNIKVKPVVTDNGKDEIKGGENYVFTKNENGKYVLVLTDAENKEHKIESDTMPVTVTDKSGSTYQIDEQGNITQISSNSGIKLDPAVCYKADTTVVSVEFAEIDGVTKYAVDPYRDVYRQVTEYYQQYKAGDKEIAASAKFMLPGTSDKFAVKTKGTPAAGFDPDKVHFVTLAGREYEKTWMPGSSQWEITVVSSAANDGQELFAVYEKEQGKYVTIALINIYTYEPLERSVTLIPVNVPANGLSKQSVESGLNRIYGKIGVHWTVNMLDAPINYTPKKGSTFNVTGSGLFSTLTDDMKALNEAFKQSGQYQEDGLYLFVLPFEASDKGEIADTKGDMPLGSQFGYLFPGADDRTIAHEVGHGAFNLEHPFDRPGRNSFTKGALANNLMDYVTGTGFAKMQWDQTRKPGLVIGLFQTDKSGMASWTIIDKKHTLLFNYVYEKNLKAYNTTNMTTYKTDDWSKEWTYSYDKHEELVDKVINKIKNAVASKTIPKIILKDYGIYIGKHKVGDKEYATAIYSRKKEISNIKKIQIVELKELQNDSIKKHLYCESTYQKYLMLAFYEDGETEPSLMIQPAKNELEIFSDKRLEEWMKYVGVMGLSNNNSNFELQLFDGDTRSGKDSTMLITKEPKMPKIKVNTIANTGEEVELRLLITYQRDGVKVDFVTPISNVRNDVSYYPANDWKKVKLNEEWSIDFGEDVRGGTAYLLCRYDDKIDTTRFYIRGTNPAETEIKNYMNQKGYISQYWFIVRMTRQESSMLQFRNKGNYNTAKLTGTNQGKGEPIYGPPKGFGLKQLDNWGNNQEATPQHLWDWKANIDGGVEVIIEKKAIVNRYKTGYEKTIEEWNKTHFEEQVSDSLYIKEGEGEGTTVLTVTEGNITFAASPTGTQKDVYDAMWIKFFNGGPRYYTVTGGGNVKPKREINRTNSGNKNYVKDVCNRPD